MFVCRLLALPPPAAAGKWAPRQTQTRAFETSSRDPFLEPPMTAAMSSLIAVAPHKDKYSIIRIPLIICQGPPYYMCSMFSLISVLMMLMFVFICITMLICVRLGLFVITLLGKLIIVWTCRVIMLSCVFLFAVQSCCGLSCVFFWRCVIFLHISSMSIIIIMLIVLCICSVLLLRRSHVIMVLSVVCVRVLPVPSCYCFSS